MPRLRRAHRPAAFLLDTRSLALYRIGLGLLLVADAIFRGPDVAIMLGPDGVFPLDALARFHGTVTLWSVAYLHDSAAWSGAVVAIEGLAGISLALGWQTRLATIVGWVALVSLIRRASPAVNAGDVWLACQMFWAMFLPLAARWSVDASRRRATVPVAAAPTAACSVATVAVVLQLVAVYLGAGLSKCNADWFTGDAIPHALSVHDHGTPLGMMLSGFPWLTRPLQWLVIAGEVVLPLLLLARPTPRVRLGLFVVFTLFHLAIWLSMTVGFFPMVGVVAWLPLLPSTVWALTDTQFENERIKTLSQPASWLCAGAGAIAACAFLIQLPPWRQERLPLPLAMAVNLTALHQQWAMFGGVPSREQWVYTRAILADGSEVDLLRDGRPVERDLPAGGFTSLHHHRWHNLFWHLAKPGAEVFAEPAARALAMEWNLRHGPDRQVSSLEIHFGIKPSGANAVVRDYLYASWPPRSPAGAGNLERLLDSIPRDGGER